MATNISKVHFKAGRLVVIDGTGAIPVAELTDCAILHEAEDKDLPSDDQMPILSVRTAQKVAIKAKVQRVISSRLQAAMFGGTVTTGAKVVVDRESHAASGTVVASETTNFVQDLGVQDNAGNWMEQVASAPAIGQYVPGLAGVGSYTFNAGQTGNVYLSFVKSTTTGESVAIGQQTQATSPTLAGWFWNKLVQPDGATDNTAWQFYKLVPQKLNEAHKRGEFAESDIELKAIADATGNFYVSHNG